MTFRKSLLQACPRLRLSTRLLDSHVYILNRTQVIPLLEANPALTSLREHVMPLIAKASWMQGLQEKADWSLGKLSAEEEDDDHDEDESVSKRLAKLSRDTFLTRQVVERSSMQASNTHRSRHSWQSPVRCLTVVSRLQQAEEGTSALPCFVARANTVATYLECNRWLLKAQSSSAPLHFALPTVAVEHVDVTSSTGEPLQASSAQISPDSIIGVGVRIGDRASIKRTVVGNRCEVGRGARLSGCILLDGSKVLEK
jgi:translation initiation factor eIF-2B subunit gamma